MRKPLVAGNWKMNKLHSQAESLFNELNAASSEFPKSVDVMVAPPALYLRWFVKESTSSLSIGIQDVSSRAKDEGAFTGEISAAMLASTGVEYAIIGHSERRQYHGETDEISREKIRACIAAGIKPIYCCGENLEERESGRHFEVVRRQMATALQGFNAAELADLVVAYEPVWAIGTGKTATSEQAQEIHADIRKELRAAFGDECADRTRILYGGSCKPSNAASIFGQPDVDGGLIGGAALVAADFMAIVDAARK